MAEPEGLDAAGDAPPRKSKRPSVKTHCIVVIADCLGKLGHAVASACDLEGQLHIFDCTLPPAVLFAYVAPEQAETFSKSLGYCATTTSKYFDPKPASLALAQTEEVARSLVEEKYTERAILALEGTRDPARCALLVDGVDVVPGQDF